MDFGLVFDTESDAASKIEVVKQLSNQLKGYFKSRSYGNDIFMFVIGIMVSREEHMHLFKVKKKPKYIKGKKSLTYFGITINVENSLEYDLLFDLVEFVNAKDSDRLKLVAAAIYNSIDRIDLVKSIKDFDKEGFKTDLKQFFKEKNLM